MRATVVGTVCSGALEIRAVYGRKRLGSCRRNIHNDTIGPWRVSVLYFQIQVVYVL
jgi:hypothetical protein